MHWADVLAEDLLKEDKKHVLATGITPSGPIHVGNMREVLTTDAVYRRVLKKNGDAELIYIADDFDSLRKVYPFLPSTYKKHVGKPLSDIPCPCNKHKNYAEHYLSTFLSSLKELGINPTIYKASDMYKTGMYKESIQIALENTDKICKIFEKKSNRQLPKKWIPFNIKCEKCDKITSAEPVLYNYPYIDYICGCGYEGTADVTIGGIGKLPWRVDWPARWKILKVTFEPFGKDHGTVGGTHDTGVVIAKEIFNYPPPKYIMYEFILLKGKGAMHSSKGTALSAEEMLKITPPEVLRFLLMDNQPNKHIQFDPGLGVLNLVDQYDQQERAYFNIEEEIKGTKDLKETYELSQPYEIPKKIPFQLPYRHLVTLVQIVENWIDIKKILSRTNQIPKDLSNEDEKHLKQRLEHVKYWIETFAPDKVKFKVKNQLPKLNLTEAQINFLNKFNDQLPNIKWMAENIHNSIYEISENEKIPIKVAFTTIYQIILGQENGPRAGFFLSNLDKDFVLKRVKEAVK
jgi:lysyl-tRNA synthetase class 1